MLKHGTRYYFTRVFQGVCMPNHPKWLQNLHEKMVQNIFSKFVHSVGSRGMPYPIARLVHRVSVAIVLPYAQYVDIRPRDVWKRNYNTMYNLPVASALPSLRVFL